MKWVTNIGDDFAITVEFNQLRPLSRDKKDRDRPHAAWDIAPQGSPSDEKSREKVGGGRGIYAPEPGELAFFFAFRDRPGRGMPGEHPKDLFDIKRHFYFYDAYGGVIILKGESGYTHVMTHSWYGSIMNYVVPYLEGRPNSKRTPNRFKVAQVNRSGDDGKRFPFLFHENLKRPYEVEEGELIGTIGNAGFSTGAHIHYEIHEGDQWVEYTERCDPKDFYPEVWEAHKDDHRRFYDMEEHRKLWQSRQ